MTTHTEPNATTNLMKGPVYYQVKLCTACTRIIRTDGFMSKGPGTVYVHPLSVLPPRGIGSLCPPCAEA